jgi:glycosyltransferase involved in cell wall biosynthesis
VKKIPAVRPPKIWMNITTSMNWDRPVVGVVRVERELARELALLYAEHEFGLCFFEGNEVRTLSGGKASSTTIDPVPSVAPVRTRSFPRSATLDPVFGWGRWLSRLVAPNRSALAGQGPRTANGSDLGIGQGDVLLSVGLDWNHSYVDTFAQLSQTMSIKIVTCCYDLIPVVAPQYCAADVSPHFIDYFTKLSWLSAVILCISQCSRNDYIEFVRRVGAPEAETLVIPLGDNVPKDDTDKTLGERGIADVSSDVLRVTEGPIILFVATIDRRKNHEVLYRAYHLLIGEGYADRLPKLVFVGMPGWGVDDLLMDIERDPLTRGHIVQLNHVSDRDLAYLYEKAFLCVYPSLYEGWGLPVGEALAYGKAVLASAQGSIPEVGGNLVTYLDPWNPRAWADEILALVDAPERVEAMEAVVRREYRVRTWAGTAAVVKTALDQLRAPADLAITLYPGYDLHTLTGTASGEAMRSTGAAGPLTHGPYRALPAGAYLIKVVVDKLEGGAGRLLCALRSGQGTREHGSVQIDFDAREHFDVVVSFPQILMDSPIDDYEIYCEVTSDLLLSINRVTIESV